MALPDGEGKHPPAFSTDVTPQDENKDEVESPSVSAPHALARFEFEFGRGNEGTKILMVEWDDDDNTRDAAGEWQITWEGMRAVLPVEEKEASKSRELQSALKDTENKDGTVAETGGTHRMYFLLLPKVAVPPLVTLTHQPREANGKATVWTTNPLPAIFPPELGASARTAGKKGVLHTIWAKQRLRTLQRELDEEARENAESVGLAMIQSEQEWIGEHFGVQARSNSEASRSPTSVHPSTPGGSRLTDKLRGLKLGTSDQALTPRTEDAPGWQNPLSPESSDVAVSSFAAIKGARTASPAALPQQRQQQQQESQQSQATRLPPAQTTHSSAQQPSPPPSRRVAPQAPPESIVQQQRQHAQRDALHSFAGIASMISTTTSSTGTTGTGTTTGTTTGGADAQQQQQQQDEPEEGLFAMPLSKTRSPEMAKSPFSFAGPDTQRFLSGVRGAGFVTFALLFALAGRKERCAR